MSSLLSSPLISSSSQRNSSSSCLLRFNCCKGGENGIMGGFYSRYFILRKDFPCCYFFGHGLSLGSVILNQNCILGTVDLGLFPNAAEKFGIALASLHQLRIYILFHDGAEISRFPELDSEAKFFDSPLSKKLLCRHFELDKLLLDYVNGK